VAVVAATSEDVPGWLELAAEVEQLFGPMVDDPEFHRALARSISRTTALCARVDDGPPGAQLAGALIFSPHHPRCVIRWLAVRASWRGQGCGTALVREAFRRFATYPCTIEVDTFGAGHPGEGARHFYEHLGFVAGRVLPPGPEGGPRQLFWLRLDGPLAASG
jgi:ribosomal protein S18 acetylase RimI-like enzyme